MADRTADFQTKERPNGSPRLRSGARRSVEGGTGDVEWRSDIDEGTVGEGLLVVEGALFMVVGDYGSTPSTNAINAGVEGSSEDSAVRLGTFGHLHVWAGTDPPDELFAEPSENPDLEGTESAETDDDPDGSGDASDHSTVADDDEEGDDVANGENEDDVGDVAIANKDGQPGPGSIGTVGAIGSAAYLLGRRIDATGGDRG